uniref:VWFA domain-containing protein n=1 Tax=Anopheles culicifacies TaxID=139723 RepID=A0A182MKM1_9DIPT
MKRPSRTVQYYFGMLMLLVLLVPIPLRCHGAVASASTIFVNSIVPSISNVSVSVPISSDNNQVPSVAVISAPTSLPPIPSTSSVTASLPSPGSSTTSTATGSMEYSVQDLTKSLENTFDHIRNGELSVPNVQKLYDSMEIITTTHNDVELLEKIALKLTRKLNQTITVIEELRRYIQHTGSKYGAKYNTLINPCPYSELINPWEDEAPFDLQSFIQSTKASNVTLNKPYSQSGDVMVNVNGSSNSGASGFLDFSAFPANADSDRPRIRITDQTIDDNNANLQQLFTEHGALMDEHYLSYRQQFYLSSLDHASAYKCHYYPRDGRLKALYLSAVRNKHVLILLDVGNTITYDQLEVAKAISKFVLYLLNENDRISIVAIGQRVITSDEFFDCRKPNRFVRATMDEKDRLVDFIDSLNRTKQATDHSAGFQYAFEAFSDIYRTYDDEVPIVFLYLGRALLPPGSSAPKTILQTIDEGQTRLPYPVIINSCLILLDEREVAHEKQLIADISTQNYARYNLSQVIYPAGKMVMISKHSFDAQRFIVALMEPFLSASRFIEEHLRIHLPYYDPALQDTVVTVSYPAGVHGLVGIDLYLSDLAEHVAYYRQQDDSYAFLIDLQGNTIMHPSFPRPLAARGSFYITNITRLEREHFAPAYKRMLADPEGNLRINHYGTNRTTMYYWKRVYSYIVCIVRTLGVDSGNSLEVDGTQIFQGPAHYLHPAAGSNDGRNSVEYNFIAASSISTRNLLSTLLYHRIDIFPPQLQRPPVDLLQSGSDGSMCRLVKQLAVVDASTLYLSASSFQSPFTHIRNNRDSSGEEANVRTIQNVMAYLKDTYGKLLFANPGLQPDVRSDVLALLQILYDYQVRHAQSHLSRYVIRRYAATVNGVLQMFPGGLLDTDLEPTKRPWFVKAMEYPGRLVFTQPYLDAGGAGYVVSVAYAILEGRTGTVTTANNTAHQKAIAVVAMDFTQTFFYKLLLDSAAICSMDNIKCLLMDDRGYLIAHPMLAKAPLRSGSTRRPVEHITHKESQVANDILNHKQLVTKKMCYNYVNRTVQRFYQFNMSLSTADVITNLMYGEKTKYQIALIPGTNLFLGIVNSTNDGGAFCPCSTVGNSCLNCNRMEQTECECPCECPLDYGVTDLEGGSCTTQTKRTKSAGSFPVPLCSPLPEELISMSAINYEADYELKSCTSINCEDYTTQSECMGLVGCEWCQVDVDGENRLNTPFCTAQLACFNGIFGAPTPYGDAAYTGNNMESILPPAYSSIGPVAGAILALCLVVGFAMYCFRQNADQSGASEHLYDDLVADHCHGLPLSRFDLDDGSPSDDCDISRTNAKQNLLLNGQHNANYMIIPNVASPYQMSSDYRRPNGGGGGGSSDHGYSTMTHHEESEHLCLSNVDPQGIPSGSGGHGSGVGNKRLSMSDSASISTSVSSPYSNHTGGPGSSFLSKPPMLNESKMIGTTLDRFTDPVMQTLLPSPTSISRTGVLGTTVLPPGSPVSTTTNGHHILVPVTVHRNMEVS